MSRLEHKTAVVTGASSGIGREIALAFAREGADVVVNYRQSRERAEKVAREIVELGRKACAVQADMSKPAEIVHLIKEARAALGRIDIWVNNAGADILTGKGAKLSDREKLQQLIDVDLKGTIEACWALAPVMREQGGGVIINMSWDLAIHGFHGRNPEMFAAVKAGVLGFSRAFACTHGPAIRINVLAPGWIQTTFADDFMAQDYYDERISEIPVGRFGSPGDVARVAVFLASTDSAYMTGEMIKINGGLS
ncbi:MAG TPA: SDR family oxidoreductase [Gammaproteobacteria bacterium]|nr:SDR family oxidoreductase [Gammaproteobacteria bacterium]